MPKLRHSLNWNTSTSAIDAGERITKEQNDTSQRGVVVEDSADSFEVLRDILSESVIQRACKSPQSGAGGRKSRTKNNGGSFSGVQAYSNTEGSDFDVEELQEFVEYLANEVYDGMPDHIRRRPRLNNEEVEQLLEESSMAQLVAATPVAVIDSLQTYGLLDSGPETAPDFLTGIYTAYLNSLVDKPHTTDQGSAPARPAECELCGRDWITLTVHHLIPREMWPKAIKRGWIVNEEEGHRRIAWICRACHNLVHRVASNEELARQYNSIELLEEREDVQRFVSWASRVRYKKR